jgi:large subunit ribosomal protein L18e
MISKTKISNRKSRKNNPEIVSTILNSMKNDSWNMIGGKISGPRKNYQSMNLKEINIQSKEGDTVVVLGKVLGTGNVDKKIRVCALSFSENAKKKLLKFKGEAVYINEEIKKNPKAEGVKFIQ